MASLEELQSEINHQKARIDALHAALVILIAAVAGSTPAAKVGLMSGMTKLREVDNKDDSSDRAIQQLAGNIIGLISPTSESPVMPE